MEAGDHVSPVFVLNRIIDLLITFTMIITRFVFFCLLFVSTLTTAQDFKSQFDEAFNDGDTSLQQEILASWEAADSSNAELFVSRFNYYYDKSSVEMINLGTEEHIGESLQLTDSTGAVVGFLGTIQTTDTELVDLALAELDKGLKLYPRRLDMRFGKIYVLGEMQRWVPFTEEILKAIEFGASIDHAWTWTFNEPEADGKAFFLSSIQDYVITLYNTNSDSLLNKVEQIASAVLKHHPEHVESISNLSVCALYEGNVSKGIEIAKKAEALAPTDAVILGNIAYAYSLSEDKVNAILYYEKVIEYGDEDMIAFAKQQIESLKE